jgi:hypothetical protein
MTYNRFYDISNILVDHMKIFSKEREYSHYVFVIPGTQIRMCWSTIMDNGKNCYFDVDGTYNNSGRKITTEQILEIVNDDIKEKIIFNLDLFLELDNG